MTKGHHSVDLLYSLQIWECCEEMIAALLSDMLYLLLLYLLLTGLYIGAATELQQMHYSQSCNRAATELHYSQSCNRVATERLLLTLHSSDTIRQSQILSSGR